MLALTGAGSDTLTRHAHALNLQPGRVHQRQGNPYDWTPGEVAALYVSLHLTRDGARSPARPALVTGLAYETVFPARMWSAPTWLSTASTRVGVDVYLASSASAAWAHVAPVVRNGGPARLVPLHPLKEALMATRWTPDRGVTKTKQPYVVTFGLTRRLVEAEDREHARLVFNMAVAIPDLLKVARREEVVVREATTADLIEFHPRSYASPLDQATLFDA